MKKRPRNFTHEQAKTRLIQKRWFRLLVVALALAIVCPAIAFAINGTSKSMNVGILQSQGTSLNASDESAAIYRWQIADTNGNYVDFKDANQSSFKITAAKIKNSIYDGTAKIRCVAQNSDGSIKHTDNYNVYIQEDVQDTTVSSENTAQYSLTTKLQNPEDDTYSSFETITKTAALNTAIPTAQDLSIEKTGFTRAAYQGGILGQVNSATVNYDRNYTIVNFDLNGGTEGPSSFCAKNGSSITTLPTPVREGYNFAGWSLDKNNNSETSVVPSVVPLNDVTYYAQWFPKAEKPVVVPTEEQKATYVVNYIYTDEAGNNQAIAQTKTSQAVIGSKVNEAAIEISGYLPINNQQEIVISENSQDNKINFYYTLSEGNCSISYYVKNIKTNEYSLYSEQKFQVPVGSVVNEQPKNIKGYIFDNSNPNNVVSGNVDANGLRLKLYYSPELLNYKVTMVEGFEGDEVNVIKEQSDQAYFGSVVDAPKIDGYVLNEDQESKTISNDPVENNFTFYYSKVLATVTYKVNNSEAGFVNRSDSYTEYIGQAGAKGAIAVAKEGYTFNGWYDSDNNKVSDSKNFVPEITGDTNEKVEYTAVFVKEGKIPGEANSKTSIYYIPDQSGVVTVDPSYEFVDSETPRFDMNGSAATMIDENLYDWYGWATKDTTTGEICIVDKKKFDGGDIWEGFLKWGDKIEFIARTIWKNEITFKVKDAELTYNGKDQSVEYEVVGFPSDEKRWDGQLAYRIREVRFEDDKSTVKDVDDSGEVSIRKAIIYHDDDVTNIEDDLNLVKKSGIIKVNPKEVHATWEDADKEYDGKPLDIKAPVLDSKDIVEGESIEPIWKLYDSDDEPIEVDETSKIGEYTAKIVGFKDTKTGEQTKNYKVANGQDVKKFRVTKKQVPVPEAKTNIEYNHSEQTMVEVAEGYESIYELSNNKAIHAGKYEGENAAVAKLKDKDNYEWKDRQTSENLQISFEISQRDYENIVKDYEWETDHLVYNGQNQTFKLHAYDTIDGQRFEVDRSEIDYTDEEVTFKDVGRNEIHIGSANKNYKQTSRYIEGYLHIDPLMVSVPEAPDASYTGADQDIIVDDPSGWYKVIDGTGTQRDAGNYTAQLNLTDTNNTKWSDGTIDLKNVEYSIAPRSKEYVQATLDPNIYDWKEEGITIEDGKQLKIKDKEDAGGGTRPMMDANDYDIDGNTGKDPGNYTLTIKLKHNYENNAVIELSWTIKDRPIDPPTKIEGLVYNGDEQIGLQEGTGYIVEGTSKATDAGDYVATAKPASGYKWKTDDEEKEYEVISYKWNIEKATPSITVDASVFVYWTDTKEIPFTANYDGDDAKIEIKNKDEEIAKGTIIEKSEKGVPGKISISGFKDEDEAKYTKIWINMGESKNWKALEKDQLIEIYLDELPGFEPNVTEVDASYDGKDHSVLFTVNRGDSENPVKISYWNPDEGLFPKVHEKTGIVAGQSVLLDSLKVNDVEDSIEKIEYRVEHASVSDKKGTTHINIEKAVPVITADPSSIIVDAGGTKTVGFDAEIDTALSPNCKLVKAEATDAKIFNVTFDPATEDPARGHGVVEALEQTSHDGYVRFTFADTGKKNNYDLTPLNIIPVHVKGEGISVTCKDASFAYNNELFSLSLSCDRDHAKIEYGTSSTDLKYKIEDSGPAGKINKLNEAGIKEPGRQQVYYKVSLPSAALEPREGSATLEVYKSQGQLLNVPSDINLKHSETNELEFDYKGFGDVSFTVENSDPVALDAEVDSANKKLKLTSKTFDRDVSVTLHASETNYSLSDSKTINVHISEDPLKVTGIEYIGDYDKTAHHTKIKGGVKDVNIWYWDKKYEDSGEVDPEHPEKSDKAKTASISQIDTEIDLDGVTATHVADSTVVRYKAAKESYGSKLGSINLTINKKAGSITVNPDSLSLNMTDKKSGKLSISGYSGDATNLLVSSDAATIASVKWSGGTKGEAEVTAVNAGNANITIKADKEEDYETSPVTVPVTVTGAIAADASSYKGDWDEKEHCATVIAHTDNVKIDYKYKDFEASEWKDGTQISAKKDTVEELKDAKRVEPGTTEIEVTISKDGYDPITLKGIYVTINKLDSKLTLSKDSMQLKRGETSTFDYEYESKDTGQTIKFESSDTDIVTVHDAEKTVYSGSNEVKAQNKDGNSTIIVSVDESDHYKAVTQSLKVFVSSSAFTFDVEDASATYNGDLHSAKVTCSVGNATVHFRDKKEGGDYLTKPIPVAGQAVSLDELGSKDVIERTIDCYVTLSTGEESEHKDVHVNVYKANSQLSLEKTQMSVTEGKQDTNLVNFTGVEEDTIKATSDNVAVATVVYDNNNKQIIVTGVKNGTTNVRVSGKGDGNHYDPQEVTIPVTVSETPGIEYETHPVDEVYDGSPHKPSLTIKSDILNAKLTYQYKDSEASEWSAPVVISPCGKGDYNLDSAARTNAGTTEIKFTIEKTDYQTASGSMQVKINQADSKISLEKYTMSFIKGGTGVNKIIENVGVKTDSIICSSEDESVAKAEFKNGVINITTLNTGDTNIIVSGEALNTNYKKPQNVDFNVHVDDTYKFNVTENSVDEYYNGSSFSPSLSINNEGITDANIKYEWTDSKSVSHTENMTGITGDNVLSKAAQTNACDIKVSYTISKANYDDKKGTLIIKINRINASIEVPSKVTMQANEDAKVHYKFTGENDPTMKSQDESIVTIKTAPSGKEGDVVLHSGTKFESTNIIITATQSTNYNEFSAMLPVEVTTAEWTVSAQGYQGDYDGSPHYATVNSSLAGAVATYYEAGHADKPQTTEITEANKDIPLDKFVLENVKDSKTITIEVYHEKAGKKELGNFELKLNKVDPTFELKDAPSALNVNETKSFSCNYTGSGTVKATTTASEIALTEKGNKSWNIKGLKQCEKATVEVTSTEADDSNYNQLDPITFDVKVSNNTFDITTQDVSGVYEPGVTYKAKVKSPYANTTIYYGDTQTSMTSTLNLPSAGQFVDFPIVQTDAGTKEFYCKGSLTGYDDTGVHKVTINVSKKKATISKVPTDPINLKSGETSTFDVGYDGDGILSAVSSASDCVKAELNADKTKVTVTGLNPGEADVNLSATEGNNYLKPDDKSAKVVVSETDWHVDASAYDGVYNKQAHSAFIKSDIAGAEITYWDKDDATNKKTKRIETANTWVALSDITRTDAGETTIVYKASLAQHKDKDEAKTLIKIAKAHAEFEGIPTGTVHTTAGEFTYMEDYKYEGDGIVVVNSDDKDIVDAQLNEFGFNLFGGKKAGETKVHISASNCKNYETPESKEFAVENQLKSFSINAAGYTGEYDGQPHYGSISASVDEVNVDYEIDGQGYYNHLTLDKANVAKTFENFPITNVETKVINYIAKKGWEYPEVKGSVTLTVNQADGSLRLPGDMGLMPNTTNDASFSYVFDGNISVESSNPDVVAAEISKTNTEGKIKLQTNDKTGSSVITVKGTGGINYKDINGSFNVSVENEPMNIETTDYDASYDGNSHLTFIKCDKLEATVTYWDVVKDPEVKNPFSFTIQDKEKNYELEKIKATNVSESTTIGYKVNHPQCGTKEGTIKLNIMRAIPQFVVPQEPISIYWPQTTDFAYTYKGDGALHIESSDTNVATVTKTAEDKAKITSVNPGNCKIELWAEEGANYLATDKQGFDLEVKDGTIKYDASGYEADYDGDFHSPWVKTQEIDASIEYKVDGETDVYRDNLTAGQELHLDNVKMKDAGSKLIKCKIYKTNYVDVNFDLKLVINKADSKLEVKDDPSSIVYPDSPSFTYSYEGDGKLAVTSSDESIVKVQYDATQQSGSVKLVPQGEEGETSIKVAVSGGKNYKDAEYSFKLRVEAGGLGVKVNGYEDIYDASEHVGDISCEQVGAEVTYWVNGHEEQTYNLDIQEASKVYQLNGIKIKDVLDSPIDVKVKVELKGYKTFETSYTLKVNAKEANIKWPELDTKEYDQSELVTTPSITNLIGSDTCNIDYTVKDASSQVVEKVINVGTYTATINSLDNTNYCLPTESAQLTHTFKISKHLLNIDITGHHLDTVFDASSHTVSGYDVDCSSILFDKTKIDPQPTDPSCSITQTNAGKYPMGLDKLDFKYNDKNYDANFKVVDGYLNIAKAAIHIDITGNIKTVEYTGEKFEVDGYSATVEEPIPDFDPSKVSTSGKCHAEGYSAGTYNMNIDISKFVYDSQDYSAKFVLSGDGSLNINPAKIHVLITGHTKELDYTGEEESVEGFDASCVEAHPKFNPKEIDASATSTVAKGTNAGEYAMGIDPSKLKLDNKNFKADFELVQDGKLTINKFKIELIIQGNRERRYYTGEEQTVSGYNVIQNVPHPKFNIDDISPSQDEVFVKGKEPSLEPYTRSLDTYTWSYKDSKNFDIKFDLDLKMPVWMSIIRPAVNIDIYGVDASEEYSGDTITVYGFKAVCPDPSYAPDFDEGQVVADPSATAVSGVNAGSYEKTLDAKDFSSVLGSKFEMSFTIKTNSKLTINAAKIYIGISGNKAETTFNGEDQSVSGVNVSTAPSHKMYDEKNIVPALPAKDKFMAHGKDASTYYMGLKPDDFNYSDPNFNAKFNIDEDGSLEIKQKPLSDDMFYTDPSCFTYDWKEYTTSLKFKEDEPIEEQDASYSKDELKGQNAGIYTINISGKHNYTDKAQAFWKINPLSIEDASFEVKLSGEVLHYTGEKQSQTIESIKLRGNELFPGQDVTITGNSATDSGVYSMTFEGVGNFTGKQFVKWAIVGDDIDKYVNAEIIDSKIGKDAANANYSSEVKDLISAFASAEQVRKMIEDKEAGKTSTVMKYWLEVYENSSAISPEHKEALEKIIALNGQTLGQFDDITAYQQLLPYDASAENVEDAHVKVGVNVQVPNILLDQDPKGQRDYYLYHVRHDGTVEDLSDSYSSVDHSFTFETDQFSDYAIAYKQVRFDPPPTPGEDESGWRTGQTSDGLGWIIASLAAVASASAGVLIYRRKRD